VLDERRPDDLTGPVHELDHRLGQARLDIQHFFNRRWQRSEHPDRNAMTYRENH
jgi:hypothetical protein